MIKILFIVILISQIFSQGMYIDLEDSRNIYSLNTELSSFVEILDNGNEVETQYYSLGLSSVLKGKNQYEINFYKYEKSKFLEAGYTYFIKPEFYLNMNFGFSYKYAIDNDDDTRNDEYLSKFSIYGNNKNSKKEKALKYFPFFTYEYIYINNIYNYDIYKIGVSVLFNDIGIEPSYSFISKDVNKITLKIYLWEFGY